MVHIIRTIIVSNLTDNIFSKNGIVTFINPYAYTYVRKRADLFENFDYIFIDGILLANFISLFYGVKINRKSFDMTSLAPECFSHAVSQNKTLYLVGDTENAINNAVSIIKKNYPGIKILGYRNGFFTNKDDEDYFITKLVRMKPDIVIVGMGLYRQENLLIKLKNNGWGGLGFTCGGFFHQITVNFQF